MDDVEQLIVFDIRQEMSDFGNIVGNLEHVLLDSLSLLDDIVDNLSQRVSAIGWRAQRFAALYKLSTGLSTANVVSLYTAYEKLYYALQRRFDKWLSDSELHIRLEAYDLQSMEMSIEIWRSY